MPGATRRLGRRPAARRGRPGSRRPGRALRRGRRGDGDGGVWSAWGTSSGRLSRGRLSSGFGSTAARKGRRRRRPWADRVVGSGVASSVLGRAPERAWRCRGSRGDRLRNSPCRATSSPPGSATPTRRPSHRPPTGPGRGWRRASARRRGSVPARAAPVGRVRDHGGRPRADGPTTAPCRASRRRAWRSRTGRPARSRRRGRRRRSCSPLTTLLDRPERPLAEAFELAPAAAAAAERARLAAGLAQGGQAQHEHDNGVTSRGHVETPGCPAGTPRTGTIGSSSSLNSPVDRHPPRGPGRARARGPAPRRDAPAHGPRDDARAWAGSTVGNGRCTGHRRGRSRRGGGPDATWRSDPPSGDRPFRPRARPAPRGRGATTGVLGSGKGCAWGRSGVSTQSVGIRSPDTRRGSMAPTAAHAVRTACGPHVRCKRQVRHGRQAGPRSRRKGREPRDDLGHEDRR